MQKYKIDDFVNGWFVGNFLPSLFETEHFEIAVKYFKAGDREAKHFQMVATEITVVIEGSVEINGEIFCDADIIVINPPEIAEFLSITASKLVCVKFPSSPNDKKIV
jgi:hypothetical protein